MKPADPLLWGASLFWGIVLGLTYFGGLWWTLRSLPGKAHPKLWLAASYGLRASFALLGFWLVMRKDLILFFITFCAFFIMRFILTRYLAVEQRGQNHAN